jgi:hypothetical protein
MASQTLLFARQHLTAADFFDDHEHDSCFHVYSSTYDHPCGITVHLYILLHDVGPQRDRAKVVLEQAFPVLTASWMRFEIGFGGGLIWQQHIEEMPEGAYDEWRFSAWAIFDEAPELLRQSGYDLKTMSVEPLPGPWKWKFL